MSFLGIVISQNFQKCHQLPRASRASRLVLYVSALDGTPLHRPRNTDHSRGPCLRTLDSIGHSVPLIVRCPVVMLFSVLIFILSSMLFHSHRLPVQESNLPTSGEGKLLGPVRPDLVRVSLPFITPTASQLFAPAYAAFCMTETYTCIFIAAFHYT